MKFKLLRIFVFLTFIFSSVHQNSLDPDDCVPFGRACVDYGLAHFYSLFHFNGRYKGDERMRVPFSIALNAPIVGNI